MDGPPFSAYEARAAIEPLYVVGDFLLYFDSGKHNVHSMCVGVEIGPRTVGCLNGE